MFERSSGVLAHISMLPGRYGCGTFGAEAERFIDLLADCGFSYWQVLPLTHPESANSPYSAYSAFALDPLFADPARMVEDGLLSADEEREGRYDGQHYRVDYETVKRLRSITLHRAFDRLTPETGRKIDEFVKEQSYWLPDYAAFMDRLKGKGDGARVRYYCFVQWVLDCQWQRVKAYAHSRGVRIFGDLPIYVSLRSADVAAHPSYFLLDRRGRPTKVAGVPPDYFAVDGQLWGNPLYNYKEMEKDGYDWWVRRIGKALRDVDALRIDHFRGFSAFWAVPAGEETARNGKWIKGPGDKLFEAVRARIPQAKIVAEDLGVLDEGVDKLIKKTGYPGMRVLQFGFMQNGEMHLPHSYTENVVAYSGTHDNNTLLGFFYTASEEERAFAERYLGLHKDEWRIGGAYSPAVRAAARALWQSRAELVILPYQDLCGWGEDTRLNTPGVGEGCWEVRVTPESMAGVDRAFWAQLNRDFGRTGKPKTEKAL